MIVEKVINAIDVNSMFKPKDKVIVAVSGGPDSICLLNILCGLRSKFEIEIFVAHVNHCLRGIEADKDEEYVHSFCRKLNIECYSKKIDINNLAKINNVSSETAGRDARYSFFNELKKELGADKIALAHNANDQAETILMRIIRGTGIEGLIGIKPIRDNVFIRPLINITRKEIEKYCEIKGLMPRIDKTNLENIYTRNKVRLD